MEIAWAMIVRECRPSIPGPGLDLLGYLDALRPDAYPTNPHLAMVTKIVIPADECNTPHVLSYAIIDADGTPVFLAERPFKVPPHRIAGRDQTLTLNSPFVDLVFAYASDYQIEQRLDGELAYTFLFPLM